MDENLTRCICDGDGAGKSLEILHREPMVERRLRSREGC
jgi:hypothetical protein